MGRLLRLLDSCKEYLLLELLDLLEPAGPRTNEVVAVEHFAAADSSSSLEIHCFVTAN